MEILYMVLTGPMIWGILAMFFGLPVWLVLAAGTYVASLRSRGAAKAREADGGKPEVSRFAQAAKITAFTALGAIASSGLAYLAGTVLHLGSGVSEVLRSISVALYFLTPGTLGVLAVLSIASIVDIAVGRRVPGRDTAIAYVTVIAMEACLLTLWATGVVHGEQVL